jgi:peptide/nickel transport system permease protein
MAMDVNITTRIATAAVVVLGVTSIVFILIHMVPGDPVEVMLGEYASSADRAELRTALGLDQPLLAQWLHFVNGVMRFDFGNSLHTGRPVSELLATHFAMTLALAGTALLVALGVGLPLGVVAALNAGRGWDAAASLLAVLGMSVPNFVLGPLLIIVFAVKLNWLPIGGTGGPAALILPALTLGTSMAALLARMVRAALADVLAEPFVTAARARGLTEFTVIVGHACRNAALPVITVIGLQLGTLLGGAVITEIVFSWPGLGQLAVESIHRRDYPVLQGCVLVISLSYVAVNTLTDIVYAILDPRIELD